MVMLQDGRLFDDGLRVKQAVEIVRPFTVCQLAKAIISDTLLGWSLQLLPPDSLEAEELAEFSVDYLKRSLERRPPRSKRRKL